MAPDKHLSEVGTRIEIDANLEPAVWIVYEKNLLNSYASSGVAARDMDASTEPAGYMQIIDAIKGLKHILGSAKLRTLLQMVIYFGKTCTSSNQVYLSSKFSKIKRALFLADRGYLVTNAEDESEQLAIPHDECKFTQHYNVNILLCSNHKIDVLLTLEDGCLSTSK